MADEKQNTPTSVVITSSCENEVSETDQSNPISSSDDSVLSGNVASSSSLNDDVGSNDGVSQSHEPARSHNAVESAVSSSSENSNGISDSNSKAFLKTPSLVIKPASFGTVCNSGSWKQSKIVPDSSSNTKSPLRSPKLNFSATPSSNTPGTSKDSPAFLLQTPKLGENPLAIKPSESLEEADSVTSTETNEISKTENQDKQNNILTSSSFGNQPSTSFGSNNNGSQNFVFGQNLHERVSTNAVKPSNEKEEGKGEASSSNGNAEMLFTSVLSTANKESAGVSNGKESSLFEDAARYQEARTNKRKLEDVELTTGEEGEENVLQINVKLFTFDNGSWLERGRATLRLNDRQDNGIITSRLVVRTHGTLRVILNTKIWSDMVMSQANERSIRLTALDVDGQPRIFLIQSSPKDMTTLYRCLEYRLRRCKEQGTECEISPEKRIALSSNIPNVPISVPVTSKET